MAIFRGKKYFKVQLDEKPKEEDVLWLKCKSCGELVYKKLVVQNRNICPKCGEYFFLTARERIKLLVDEGSFEDISRPIKALDPLNFVGAKPYKQSLKEAQDETGLTNEIIVGSATMEGVPVILAVMDFRFIGGSMGSVMGEQISHGIRTAAKSGRAFILVSATGGARMQEGILSLMQMAKTSDARLLLEEAGVPYISVMTYPTTAGVEASIASLGDVTIAERGALIGFTGARVIKGTIGQELPTDFQTDRFALEHGIVDQVVRREDLRSEIARILKFFVPAQDWRDRNGQQTLRE
ncbi:acetyl-CoA carboxylase, carboxyltransferase subunit beta [Candidatus Acetothermia bacterium]|nr:acetyl-CoA carboxylase, carboxyltransferase subunit beta [Candidatus Acetothermia bacterium]MBI3642905.1 acetyl-CoA carboxylase, carboxyltransferase subunit beta [Candidatus Acetothermia bacterium]